MTWPRRIAEYTRDNIPVARVIIAEVRGSAPRDAGADMFVTEDGIEDTIGGGQLEYEAIAIARKTIKKAQAKPVGFHRHRRSFALGPNLGQCCGGNVVLLIEAFAPQCAGQLDGLDGEGGGFIHGNDTDTPPQRTAKPTAAPVYDGKTLTMPAPNPAPELYVYGAGHVGRALMDATTGLSVKRTWVDTANDRFPENIANDITIIPATDMAVIAAHAPAGAIHIVLTYSHRFDEAIVHALVRKNDFLHLGLIGSKTKLARFKSSLKKSGIDKAALDRIICPIGLPQITHKAPAHVALGIAGQIAVWLEQQDS